MGKTGTANHFTNSAFAGVVPGPHKNQNGFATENGYTVTAYVGFDTNDPMVRNSTLREKNYGAQLDLVDLAFSADPITGKTGLRLVQQDLGQKTIPVSIGNGLPLSAPHKNISPKKSDATSLTFGTLLPSGELEPARIFQPFWSN
jgi:membrane peptidoglycan carboxypeptidase